MQCTMPRALFCSSRRVVAEDARLADLGPEGREAGAALHEAFLRRTKGDYDAEVLLGRNDAIAARDRAVAFVDFCRKLQRKRARPNQS
jgi:hypothetical protein